MEDLSVQRSSRPGELRISQRDFLDGINLQSKNEEKSDENLRHWIVF